MAILEEIRHVTWDLDGEELTHLQTIQRIINTGFPMKGGVAFVMFAIVEGESGQYLKAWHINCEREEENAEGVKLIKRYPPVTPGGPSQMKVKTIDLGLMQINTHVTDFLIDMTAEAVGEFVEGMWVQHPELANGFDSCEIAYQMWTERGFQPWFAYQPGTDKWKIKLREASIGFANWAARSFMGKTDPHTGKPTKMNFV